MLDQADTIFTYRLVANNQQLACDKRGTQLSCDLAKIKLEQSQTYEIAIQRLFNNTLVGAALKQSVATVDPVQIVAASIAADQLIYHVPASLTLTLSKPVQSHPDVKLYALTDKTRRELPVTTILKEKTLTVQFTQPLPRQSVFEFSIPELKAYDGGYLVSPYTLPFRTSGGPKVMGVSVGSYKVRPGSALTLTFDTTIATNQAVKSFVRIETGSGVLAATYAIQDKRITVTPITPLPRCTLFTVKVLDGLQNEAGVSGGSAWQFRSRTLCQTTATIGSSVQGHGITAYRFGEGSSIILFVGGTHGNEKSSTYILDSWIDYFEANYERLPKDRSVIVIPKINPDGFATNTRTNARTVDLNRNFPANNWKSGVTMPDKSYLEYGGGGTPLSEPESKALADYTLSLRPRLVLTYHATGGVVVANESDDSVTQARAYGNKASIQSIGNSGIGNFFEYDTTGSYEDWLHDKHAIPALLIELTGMAGNEFARHQGAMWAISQIP
ncbi:MAG TPA: M14 family metallopeptidase [Candidatus Saccharimonadales bacterium]|nr:M14 family metallopeptidase [Candidatus Saccharimonadales bacterium]